MTMRQVAFRVVMVVPDTLTDEQARSGVWHAVDTEYYIPTNDDPDREYLEVTAVSVEVLHENPT